MEQEAQKSLIEQIVGLREEGRSWREVAEILGRTQDAVRSLYRYYKRRGALPRLVHADSKKETEITWRDLVELAKRNQHINCSLERVQDTAIITIETDKPIGIVFSGDWHLGAIADYNAWVEHITAILENPNLFLIDLGDDIQNVRSFKTLSVVLDQVLSPKQQLHLLRSVIDELSQNNKLIAKIRGNHDHDFDTRLIGEALQDYLLANCKAPQFVNRGVILLRIGEQEYTIAVLHKPRSSSRSRPAHGEFVEMREFFPADVIAGAHTHQPGMEVLFNYIIARKMGIPIGGMTLLIKVGTFQRSEYGWSRYGIETQFTPCVVFYPDEHKIVPFTDIQTALSFLRGYYNDG